MPGPFSREALERLRAELARRRQQIREDRERRLREQLEARP